ncbi:MAG: argininosuccinate lyase [Bacteroidetes bacterium]|nr:MAG: argininosuccinate lyase [Bacteroidota bacterium]
MKLWDKGYPIEAEIEAFTVGEDRSLDLALARWDVAGTLAHITMLERIGLLEKEDLAQLRPELLAIHQQIIEGDFSIEPGVEDIHSQVELMLTRRLGEAGKKVHSGRSRNDQVLTDIRLYFLHETGEIAGLMKAFFDTLQAQSERYREVLLPGYTHFQIAMPSSFGLWLGAYAESLADDLWPLLAAWRQSDQNPLGSAAGYGSSFPLDRSMTARLMGFSTLSYNVVYAQMGRGRSERALAAAMSSIAFTLNKLSADVTLYMSQNMGFISFPDELTTGSSIMPHKKNPDVFELIRARCNRIQALSGELALLTTNLPSGYHRDFQLLKAVMFPAIRELKSCLRISNYMIQRLTVQEHILDSPMYDYLFSVEEVNKAVLNGTPFREAYRQVGEAIRNGSFSPDKHVSHSHEGSIGKLCTAEIRQKWDNAWSHFGFEAWEKAIEALLS